MMKIRATARIFSCSGRCAKISLKFTDKEPIFADLSVSKPHFTDKPTFSSDLSVNFWPLWWWFTDKAGFLKHLSVKTGPKRLNFYGQTAIFDHFVRKRHFSSEPFTDRRLIFIDLSVNGSDFVKYSTRSISAPSSQSNLPPSSFWRLSCIRNRIRFAIDCKSSDFSIWGMVFSQPLPARHN